MADSGIYEIVNLVNGKRYIGSAVDLRKRWNGHRMHLRRGSHHSRHLQSSWQKHGEQAFAFQVICKCDPSDLIEFEQREIDLRNPEYNISRTAGSIAGYRHTAEALEKMRAANVGRKLTPDHVAAIRRGKTGKPRPDMKGNKFGCRRQSEAERLLNSASKIGRPKSSSAKANIAAAARTPEMRARRSEFMKAVWARRKAARL